MPTLVSSGISNATQIINWVNSIGSSLISAGYSSDATPVPQIVIDDKLYLKNFVADNSARFYFESTQIGPCIGYFGNPKSLIIIYDTDFVYLKLSGCWSSGTTATNSGILLYSKVLGSMIYGCVSGVANPVIENMTITDATNANSYTLSTVFRNYTLDVAHLDYTQKRLFKNGIKSTIPMPDFIDCSTVDLYKVVSFSGSSYFSVGNNTLIRVTIPIES